jgi:hypothetical protein
MVKEKKPTYTKEADMCADFIAALPKEWTAYCETSGWDILLVHDDGTQIGVEAKLSLNAKVIIQSMSGLTYQHSYGPDFRAVLIPGGKKCDYEALCSAIGIQVMTCNFTTSRYISQRYRPSLPDPKNRGWDDQWHPWLPANRCKLPEYVPDVSAGHPSPNSLSHWKIKAIKLLILAETRPIKRSDFKYLQLSPTRWTERSFGWFTPTINGYVRNDRTPDLKSVHPINYEQIKADFEKWAPKNEEMSKTVDLSWNETPSPDDR